MVFPLFIQHGYILLSVESQHSQPHLVLLFASSKAQRILISVQTSEVTFPAPRISIVKGLSVFFQKLKTI